MANFKSPVDRRLAASNIAEDKCEEYLSSVEQLYWTRFGFDETNNNIPFKYFKKIDDKIRNTPDYVCISPKKAFFIETKGFAGCLKIKHDDLESYDFWNEIMDLYFFIYDCINKKHYKFTYSYIKLKIRTSEAGVYPDNNKIYYKVEL